MADEPEAKGNNFSWSWAGGVVAATYHAVTKDGVLGASLNQGRDELAMALKAFPDSIRSDAERGTVWDEEPAKSGQVLPLASEKEGKAGSIEPVKPLPTPSEIAKDKFPPVQVAEVEKSWVEKEIERREKAGNNSGGDQNQQERARVLPIEQQQEKDTGRGR